MPSKPATTKAGRSGVIENADLVLVEIFRGGPLSACATPEVLAGLARRGLIATDPGRRVKITAAGIDRALPLSRKLRSVNVGACNIGGRGVALDVLG
jgi:hypothetical protein